MVHLSVQQAGNDNCNACIYYQEEERSN